MQIQVNGLEQLGRELLKFPQVLAKKYLGRATYAAAALIKADAVARAPVRTGNMRDAIAVFKKSGSDTTAEYDIGVRKIRLSRTARKIVGILRRSKGVKRLDIAGDAYYWRFLEFGTSKMSARPFLRPAFEAQKENAVAVFKTILADGVQAAVSEVRGK